MGMESPALDVWPAPVEPLPRGPHGLPRDVVVRSQRTRMLRALIEVVAEKGYAGTTVADVTGRAGVSRTTFYQQFKDKEDCFLAAYQKGADAQFRKVIEAVESTADPLEQLRRNLRAYLGELVAYPASARAFLLEVAAAGPRALTIRAALRLRYAELLQTLHGRARERTDGLPELPLEVFRAAVAAVDELVVRWISEGRVAELGKLEPIAVYVELALFGVPGAVSVLAPPPE
jgi:AcrR family transcriptional regulator